MKTIILEKNEEVLIKGQKEVCLVAVNINGEIYSRIDYKRLEDSKDLNNSKYIYVPEINKEVEIEVHDKNKSYNDLKDIYGEDFEKNLLTKEECEKILKNHEISKILKMDGSSSNDDFFIQQYNEEDKKRGYVAGFYVYGFRSGFCSVRDSRYANDCRGVRFCRKKIGDEK